METRSFADYLRTLDDAALISLFSHRPDLVTPVPPDVASLAVRASSSFFKFNLTTVCGPRP